MTRKVSAQCLPSCVSQGIRTGRNALEEAGQLTGKGSGGGGKRVLAWAAHSQAPSRSRGLDVLTPAHRSALWHFTWHFKNELGVQFVAKDEVGHLPWKAIVASGIINITLPGPSALH